MDSHLEKAIQYTRDFPEASIRSVAKKFGIGHTTLRYRLQRQTSKIPRTAPNKKLSVAEEKAICRYIDRLDSINLAVRPEFIVDAANAILRAKAPAAKRDDPPTVGVHWATRFFRRHNYSKQRQKTLNADRAASEDFDRVVQYFQKLQKIIEEAGVVPEDIWNMDETGFRIGVGKDQLIVTKRKRSHYFSIPENRESATLIEAISAGGRYTPAFILLAGQNHMAHWYHQQELERETVIRPTPTGYTNDEISLEWIQHFDKHTEICRRGWKRLLILDGHGSHHTKEFIEYCDRHDIIPFGLPPNLTHLLQPLDVVVFQPLKHYHAKALDLMVRDGLTNITKIEFLSCIQDVRKKAFKESTIRSAFKKIGIWPFYPQPVLDCVRSRMAASKTPTPPPPPGPESSPFNTPLTVRQVHKVAWAIEKGLEDVGNVSPELAHDMSRFIKGSLSNVAELLQTKRDLGRTRYAEKIANRRRAMKNKVLQSGGVLTVQEGRAMVRRREQDELDKAREMIGKREAKARNGLKRWFSEAAKVARRWRAIGKLARAEIYEIGHEMRLLKRF
ncbi:hypothetical protein HIM_11903 [Hirsutella minnesotensis 3608]|uniref:HTH CENPB-type domain-containing protein n=1 Tax=Hirsutella minnesotensis 3608 TaxID=1043627 RepID=A0A0F7ZWB9_9HYPO|nr:hypothetical protein HIM_11903 [Hirsutella minnesotensis 3608]